MEIEKEKRKIEFWTESMTINEAIARYSPKKPFTKMVKLEAESISKEKVLKPFWNSQCREISQKLWLPTVTDCAGSVSTLSGLSSKKTVENSWFSTTCKAPLKKSLSTTSFPSFTFSHAESTGCGNTLPRSRRIRIYPTAFQRQKLRQMMGTARYTFNQTVNYLNDQGTFANWMAIKKGIIDSLPEWSRETPYQVRSIAVKDACEAVKLAKRKFKATGKFNKVHFKRRKDVRQSLFITKAAISEKGIFVRVLGKMLYTEPLPKINHDCRLVYEYGKWFVSIPVDVEKQIAKNKQDTVSIDPGVRTFLTCYTSDGVIELGSNAWERTLKICHSLDSIQSRMTKAKARRRQNMKRAFKRLQFRLDNLKAELHWKCATFLAKNFDTIVIPNFNANEMSARQQRKITSKTVRSMLSLGHSKFREILKMQCEKYGGNVLTTTEEYTSKTCPACGEIHASLGGAKVYKCPHCGCKVPRDANGARNILLHAMVDSPTLVKQCATVGFC